jgi:hypothetical protein
MNVAKWLHDYNYENVKYMDMEKGDKFSFDIILVYSYQDYLSMCELNKDKLNKERLSNSHIPVVRPCELPITKKEFNQLHGILNALKKEIAKLLINKGYLKDSDFEYCFKKDYSFLGCYARPKDKPTYLDPQNNEESYLQEYYAIDGMKQDFSEWVELYRLSNGIICEFSELDNELERMNNNG